MIMDYEEAYKKALERARQVHTTNVDENKKSTEYIFPELKESEDERIRKELIEHIKANRGADFVLFQNFSEEEIISWLEKQVSPQMVADAYLRGCNDTEKKWLKRQEEQKQQCKSTTVSSSDITTITTATNENECFTH